MIKHGFYQLLYPRNKDEKTKNQFNIQLEPVYDLTPNNLVKIIQKYFNANVGGEKELRPVIGNQ